MLGMSKNRVFGTAKVGDRGQIVIPQEARRFFGISFKQYLLAKRLSGAKEYLKYSRMSVGEIAERTGFETPSYFVRIFKRAEGISPLAFRRKSQ